MIERRSDLWQSSKPWLAFGGRLAVFVLGTLSLLGLRRPTTDWFRPPGRSRGNCVRALSASSRPVLL